MNSKKKILVVDDSEMNRALLEDMLSADYDIFEAENGMQAVAILHEHELEICLVLLDIVMPVMDGFETLAMMNKKGWIKTIPVVMISAETASTYMDRAYGLGAVDYISRPFDERTVRHRVDSNVILGEKQRELSARLTEQLYEKEKDNRLMIEILSHIVEFRNGESGLHVLHVHAITERLLKTLRKKTDMYQLTQQDIMLISNASALHDVGKISIPSEILNKPGRFTPEEFEIMKKHTVEGAKMLKDIPMRNNEPLIKIGYQICRWHHERYDGRGYPDGLKGEEIPIAAQIVSLADVYDALTAERVYKSAYPPEKAVEMILNGECGAFNPLLLECLKDIADDLKKEIGVLSVGNAANNEIQNMVVHTLKTDGTGSANNRTVRLLEHERMKTKALSDLSREIIFEYSESPEIIKLSEWGADLLGLPTTIIEPRTNKFGKNIFSSADFEKLLQSLKTTSPDNPGISEKYKLNINGAKTWCKVIAKAIWSDTEPPEYEGAIGKILDINEETEEKKLLEEKANLDFRTGLLNHEAAKKQITSILKDRKNKKYVLVFFDLDNFKHANDEYGHLFGDEVLEYVAQKIKKNTRSSDISARMGGDEFIIFMEYKGSIEPLIKRIFTNLTGKYKEFNISLSMGVAFVTDEIEDYDTLFAMADKAAYSVKRSGKLSYCFYDDSLKDIVTDRENK